MKEQLLGLDSITLNFGAGGMQLINYVLAIIMFGVALGTRVDMFKKVFTKPKSVILGLCLQWFALPAITFLLICIFKNILTPMVALGMVLVACCPGGNISNFMSSLSKGNVELSVSMTAITTLGAPLMTPFNFWLWGNLCYRLFAKVGEVPELV
ncbi:MAG: bile acid:sodium symporter, partial [Bacteroidales bacterium]|nr:bile acid:sodium symporter [Bacteroidales bacterium]